MTAYFEPQRLILAARNMPRVWRYEAGRWSGRGLSLGDDEYGRRTLVLGLPGDRAVVWAFWTCRCGDCDESREQTARWGVEDPAECPDYAQFAAAASP